MNNEKEDIGIFNNLHRIGELIDKGDYKIIPKHFTSKEEETKKCTEWCRQWFNKQPLDYKLKNTRTSLGLDRDIIWLIDFTMALKEYWDAHKDRYDQHRASTNQDPELAYLFVVLNYSG